MRVALLVLLLPQDSFEDRMENVIQLMAFPKEGRLLRDVEKTCYLFRSFSLSSLKCLAELVVF